MGEREGDAAGASEAWRIVVLDPISETRAAELRALLPAGFALDHARERGLAHLKALIRDADFAIAGQVAVPAELLEAASRLKLLHKWGVGVDNIDLDAAARLGLRVARTTGANALAVAEFTIGLMIAALRGLACGHHHLQSGDWRGVSRLPGPTFQLSGKTVGIVGFGAIGRRTAQLLQGFGCRILYAGRDPSAPPDAEAAALGATPVGLGELLEASDVVSLHCPLTEATRGLIDAAAIDRMKRTAVLVNVARGGVVDEAALVAALKARRIHAAAMDVFSVEPLPPDSPLIGLDNLVLTPHLAAVTADGFAPTARRMFDTIARVARGEPPPERDVVV